MLIIADKLSATRSMADFAASTTAFALFVDGTSKLRKAVIVSTFGALAHPTINPTANTNIANRVVIMAPSPSP
jgi:hypothetical protein